MNSSAAAAQNIRDLENRFSYHPPIPGQTEIDKYIRDTARAVALTLTGLCPPSRELSLAITHLEEMVFWAAAAIARHPSPSEELPEVGAE